MKLIIATAAALMLVQPAAAGKEISQATVAGGDDMCAGYISEEPNKVYYGPCESKATFGEDNKPYFSSEVKGFALAKGDDKAYLTDNAKLEAINGIEGSYKVYSGEEDGYAYVAGSVVASSQNPSCKGAGGKVGICAKTGASYEGVNGMLGFAYYLNTGEQGKINTKTMTFPFYSSHTDPLNDPKGQAKVCIASITGGACGLARTFSPGELKFSIFGIVGGKDIKAFMDTGEYLGVRTLVDIKNGDKITGLKFNGDKDYTTFLKKSHTDFGTDVTSFTVEFEGGKQVTHEFVQTYTVGSIVDDGFVADGNITNGFKSQDKAGVHFSRTIKIKAHPKGELPDIQGVYFDYLFAVAPSSVAMDNGLNSADRYFVYDPTVSSGSASKKEVLTSGATQAMPAIFLAACLAAVL